MNINMLKGKIAENGINVATLAELIGVDSATLYRKLNNCDKFTIGEALKIKDALSLSNSDACEIFLN